MVLYGTGFYTKQYNRMLTKENTGLALEAFTKYVVQQARTNLSKGGKNVSKKLYNSLKGESTVSPNSIQVGISMEQYGEFVDQGVKGKTSSSKAPASPFRFGTGSGRKGGLTEGIKEWVRSKRLQFRDRKTGKYLSYDSTAFLITRSVYHKGIKPTYFITRPFEAGFANLPDEIVEAYGLDIDKMLKTILDNGKGN